MLDLDASPPRSAGQAIATLPFEAFGETARDKLGPAPDAAAATDAYAKRFSGPLGAWMLEVQAETVMALLPAGRPLRILDVGGGHGQLAPILAAAGHRVSVAMSPGADQTRLRRAMGGAADIHTGPVERLAYADRSFDVVLSVRMMAHVSDWPAFLAELCRVANTAVIIDFPAPRGANALGGAFFGLKRWVEGDTRRYASMTTAAVERVFAENGLTDDGTTGQFVLPMALHRLVNRAGMSRRVEGWLRPLCPRFGNPVIARAVRRPE